MKKGLIVTTALAMVLGAGVAVGAHQTKAQRVEAATSTTVYYAVSSSVVDTYTVKLNVNFKGDGDDWHQYTMNKETDTFDGKDVYSYTYTDAYDGVGVMQFQLYDGETWIMQQEPINSWTTVDNYNGKVWVHNDGWYTYTPDVPGESVYKFKINSGTVTTMEEGDDGQVVSEEIRFDKGDRLTFYKDDVELEAVPKDDAQLTKVFKNNNKLEFAQDYTGVLYLKKTGAKLWAGQFTPGYYLAGVDGEWEPKLATPAVAHDDSYLISNIHLTANTEVKFIQAPDNGGFNWFNADTSKLTVGEGVSASVITESGLSYGNLKVEAEGDYDLYYTPENGWYSIYKYVEPAADPVYTVSCRNNPQVTFELDEEGKPEGVVHQYSAVVDYAYRAGSLQFYRDGDEITSGIGVGEDANNNIYGNTTDGFRIYSSVWTNMKIYLKTYSDGGISVFGEGYEENEFTSVITQVNGVKKTVTLTIDNEFTPNATYIKQYKTSAAVSLKALPGTDWPDSFDLNCAGVSEDLSPEVVAGNNAMQAFQSTAWKVHNDCNEVIYLKLARSDLSLHMYIGGYEDAHVLRIGGKDVTLHKANESEYYATGVELSSGDVAASYTIEGVEQDFTAKVVGNNNLAEDKSIIASATCDIYFNITNNTLFVSGLPTGGYHMLKNNRVVEMVAAGEYEGFTQYKSEKITFHVGDEIQFVDCNGAEGVKAAEVFAVTTINMGGLGSKFEYNEGSELIECIDDCSAAVYLKLKYHQDEIYFGEVEEYIEEAINFANAFKAAMATACSASGKQSAVETAWATQASAFAELSEEAQNEVKLGGFSSVEEIQEFGERYMGIKQQHPDWDLSNFLHWDIPNNPAFIPAGEQSSVSKNANILIIIVAAVSVVSLATLIVIKKRKHN